MKDSTKPSTDKTHWKGHQWSQMTSEDLQQASQDLKEQSPASKRAAKRGTFMPTKAKKPF